MGEADGAERAFWEGREEAPSARRERGENPPAAAAAGTGTAELLLLPRDARRSAAVVGDEAIMSLSRRLSQRGRGHVGRGRLRYGDGDDDLKDNASGHQARGSSASCSDSEIACSAGSRD